MIALLFITASAWVQISDRGGVLVEARPVAGLAFKEHRLSAKTTASIEAIDAYFHDRFQVLKDARVIRTVLEKTPDKMVFHDRLKMPIGSDRYFTLDFRRTLDTQTKVLEWKFNEIDSDKSPACDGCVKMVAVHGSWTFAAAQDGGSDISYVVYSDPGGDLPKWMVASKQTEAATNRIKLLIKDLQSGNK